MSRREDARRQLEADGWQTVYGDFDDRASLDLALRGVKRAFLVCTPDERLQDRETGFIDAAVAAGLDRVVLLSGFPVPGADSPILDAHAAVERHLEASGLDFTVIRPLGFMQTIYWMSLPMIEQDGIMAAATGEGRNAVIDLRDVGQVAFRALTEEHHSRAFYDLTGPEALTMAEMAQTLGHHLGRTVRYVDLAPQQFSDGMRTAGVVEVAIKHTLAVFGEIRNHRLDQTTSTLSTLGIRPHSWQEFSSDVVAGRTSAATSFDPPAR